MKAQSVLMKIRNGIYAQKKAISPIIATVLIIAVTLIAAVAIGGFVFGIFGSASATANIQVTAAVAPAAAFIGTPASTVYTCASAATAVTTNLAYLSLVNTGTASATVTGVTITWAGASNVFNPTSTCTVGAAGSTLATAAATMDLVFTAHPTLSVVPVTGQTYSITVTLSNGASVLYTGTFQ